MGNGQIATLVTLEILPDKEVEFRGIMEAMIADVRANEPETLLYYLARSSESGRYHMFEIYASTEAAAAHNRRETVRSHARAIGPCLARPVTIEKLEGVI